MSDVAQPVFTTEQRRQALQNAALQMAQEGWRIEAQADSGLVISKPGRKPNHILHLVLSLLTAGVWLLVWLIVAVKGPQPDIRKRLTLTPDMQWRWEE